MKEGIIIIIFISGKSKAKQRLVRGSGEGNLRK